MRNINFVQWMVFVAKEGLTGDFSVQYLCWRIKCCKENIPKECVKFTKKVKLKRRQKILEGKGRLLRKGGPCEASIKHI